MKKIITAALCAMLAAACAEAPEYDFLHDDCTVHSAYCTPLNVSGTQVSATINNEAGTIEFAIPHDKYQKKYKLDSLKIKANVGYDAFITPSLSSQVWDLNEDLKITVTAAMTGNKKEYVISAYKMK